MSRPVTLGQAYRAMRDVFRTANISTPEIDARLLVGDAAGVDPSRLIIEEEKVLDESVLARIANMRAARLERIPVGRIVGHRAFWGLEFSLSPATLEPRPDTEILVEAVLETVDRRGLRDAPLRFADLGTGSGAILVALLSELPKAFGIGVDLSFEALIAARSNAAANDVVERAAFVQGSYAEALGANDGKGLDWIVSNPPYIRAAVLADLDPEVRRHDPELALCGGEDGLDAYRVIAAQAGCHLHSCGGSLYLEIGYDQAQEVSELCRLAGFSAVEVKQDLNGLDRVVTAEMQ